MAEIIDHVIVLQAQRDVDIVARSSPVALIEVWLGLSKLFDAIAISVNISAQVGSESVTLGA